MYLYFLIPQGGGRTGSMSGEVLGGGRTADDEGQWRTADREKFLLRFSTAVKPKTVYTLNHFIKSLTKWDILMRCKFFFINFDCTKNRDNNKFSHRDALFLLQILPKYIYPTRQKCLSSIIQSSNSKPRLFLLGNIMIRYKVYTMSSTQELV